MQVILYFCLAAILKASEAQDQTCPSLGEDSRQSIRSYSTEESLYLNIKEPSQCNGTVTQWNFCFFNFMSSQKLNSVLGVRFLMYRRNGATEQAFTAVPNSVFTLTVNSADLPMQGCSNVTLNASQRFQVLENDIVAACVLNNNGDVPPLFVTSTTVAESIQVYQDGYNMCRDDQLSMIDLSVLNHRTRNTLHLYATLDGEIPPRVGNNPPSSSYPQLDGLQGTYLNMQFPAENNGSVTIWHFCYYPAAINNSMQAHSAMVAVWRYDSNTEQYDIVNGSIGTLELQPNDGLLTSIYCTQQSVDNFLIRQGDFVGVVMPSTYPIPLFGSNTDYMLNSNTQQLSPMSMPASGLTSQQLALHLYADITMQENASHHFLTKVLNNNACVEVTDTVITSTASSESPVSTDSIPTTPPTSTDGIPTTPSMNPPLSAGALAAIIIVCLLLLLTLVAITFIVAVYVMKSKLKRRKHPTAFGKGTITKRGENGADLLEWKKGTSISGVDEKKSGGAPDEEKFLTSENMAYGGQAKLSEDVMADDAQYSEISMVRGRPTTRIIPQHRTQHNNNENTTALDDNNYYM